MKWCGKRPSIAFHVHVNLYKMYSKDFITGIRNLCALIVFLVVGLYLHSCTIVPIFCFSFNYHRPLLLHINMFYIIIYSIAFKKY